MSEHEEPEGYEGEVAVVVDGVSTTTRAALAARFDPLAGSVVWSGRVAVQAAPRTRLEITTPHGTSVAEATEADPWGNTRVSGIGRPPFRVELLDEVG
ncbi:DUF4873 domain-containing protein [Blastococcus sp. TF02-8]|uniref:DUF4873 domain-containing protein n=1 Tax=Blastococcus sp. TF02-8 TaxID=2250574 RepID=UPI000DE9FC93|nr:DUF4873 domain-containing protein [Blastococcus sp. TF02-8]RBY93376.1 DUF4873 domain-containing protein [Blastococcus sp. TF02-8]